MERAARAVADCLKSGHMVYTLGTGHGHLLALEVFYRAGGMARVCPILDERLMLHQNASESTLWERREEQSLTGAFLRALWQRRQADPAQQAAVEQAARFGLAALERREDPEGGSLL